MSEFRIRRMTRSEVDQAVQWAAREGWNPGLHDAAAFWAVDPEGFFAGEVDGRVVACGSALRYDERFAFCGFYIVDPALRGRGFGLQLTHARLAHIGDRNAGLDGVLAMVDRYARLGYTPAHTTTRFTFVPNELRPEPLWVKPVEASDWKELFDYDALHHFARRERFLEKWLVPPDVASFLAKSEGSIRGYGVLRPCVSGFKIGPLFAEDAETAETLLGVLCNRALGQTVSLDVPEPNAAGIALARRWSMTPTFACIRMYLRGNPCLPLDKIFGITSFEAG